MGAAYCVTHDGEVVVDLVGGRAHPERDEPWTEDTLVMVWSCTKGALALCAHLLASSGTIDLDASVVRYWPEFGRHGKREITVAMLLNHQAGLPGVTSALAPDDVLDEAEMASRLVDEAPQWTPRTRHGYHSLTFGWLVGEVLRRTTGASAGDLFGEMIARPLALDFWIGLPASHDQRVATVQMALPNSGTDAPFERALRRGARIQRSVLNSFGVFGKRGVCERPEVRRATVPAVNGITNAKGLALMYMPAALGSSFGDLQLSARARQRMVAVESASSCDAVTLVPSRFSSGFQKASLNRAGWEVLMMSEEAFGHAGHGGSFGFADPARRLSAGYVMNHHRQFGENERHQALIDATYRCAGSPLSS